MTQSNKKIAITGGIGSGKSCVLSIIKQQGYPAFSCDEIYSKLLLSPQFVKKLAKEFGEGILNEEGLLNRPALSRIVFSDERKLKRLNQITHPRIMEAALKEMEGFPLSFLEVPLLFENGFEALFDGVIVVLRGEAQRIASVMQRDGISCEETKKRIKSQFDYENFNFTEYYVIHNNSNLDDLRANTLKTLQRIVNA